MNTAILAGMHATGALFMIWGLTLAIIGLPDWKPGETAHLWDGANTGMIIRGLALACIAAPLVIATAVT